MKKEIKGMHIAENNLLYYYTYHQIHVLDLDSNTENIFKVKDDSVYQYLFDNALKNSDYNTYISPKGNSVIYEVAKRNLFWFIKKGNSYTLLKHIENTDQYSLDYSTLSFVNENTIITGGPYAKILIYRITENNISEHQINLEENGAICSLDVSNSGEFLCTGTGSSSYQIYNLAEDSLAKSVSLKRFQNFCDSYWCSQIPKKVQFYDNETKIALLIANHVNAILSSKLTGSYYIVRGDRLNKSIDFDITDDHFLYSQ